MSEIPEFPADVLQEAAAEVGRMPDRAPFKADVMFAIARAIAAERERCAQLAQTLTPEGIHPDDLYRWRDTAGAIAAAIRSGN